MHDNELKWLGIAALLLVGAGALWYLLRDDAPPAAETVVTEPETLPEALPPREPLHPVEPLELEPSEGELVELPPLDESDSYFTLALVELFGADMEELLSDSGLIDKSVASSDSLTRDRVAEKIRPVGRIPGSFEVTEAGANGPWYISPDNYARYDFLVDMLTGANPEDIVATYRRFYPLIQEAYVRLGYPDAYFNDRAVAVIDELLATPEPDQPIQLVRPHVLYEFADPELEALSAGQKLLLRMGPDHATRIRTVLADIRQRIAQAP